MSQPRDDDPHARLRALKAGIVEEAKASAAAACAVLPEDLAAEEEPAHIYRAAPHEPEGDAT